MEDMSRLWRSRRRTPRTRRAGACDSALINSWHGKAVESTVCGQVPEPRRHMTPDSGEGQLTQDQTRRGGVERPRALRGGESRTRRLPRHQDHRQHPSMRSRYPGQTCAASPVSPHNPGAAVPHGSHRRPAPKLCGCDRARAGQELAARLPLFPSGRELPARPDAFTTGWAPHWRPALSSNQAEEKLLMRHLSVESSRRTSMGGSMSSVGARLCETTKLETSACLGADQRPARGTRASSGRLRASRRAAGDR